MPADVFAVAVQEPHINVVRVTASDCLRVGGMADVSRGNYPDDWIPPHYGAEIARLADGMLQVVYSTNSSPHREVAWRSSDGGRSFAAVQLPAGYRSFGAIDSAPDGTLVAVEDWRCTKAKQLSIWLRSPAGVWTSRPLPVGFQPQGASVAPDGTICVAGGQIPRPERSWKSDSSDGFCPACGRAFEALAILTAGATRIVRPSLPEAAVNELHPGDGGAQHLWGVDATAEPLLAVARWSGGRPHFRVWVEDAPNWNWLERPLNMLFEPRVFRERPGLVSVYDRDFTRYRTTNRDRNWNADDLRPAMMSAWPDDRRPTRVTIKDVDVAHGQVAAILRPTDADDRRGDVIMVSTDDGTTFAARAPLPPAWGAYQSLCAG